RRCANRPGQLRQADLGARILVAARGGTGPGRRRLAPVQRFARAYRADRIPGQDLPSRPVRGCRSPRHPGRDQRPLLAGHRAGDMVGDAGTMSDATLQLYHRQGRRNALLVGVLGVAALAALLLDLVTGPAGLPLAETLRALTGGEVGRGTQVIVWDVRLPVACMALLVGAALALAGAEMQTVLENPLAESFTLGVSSSAALGAAVAIVLGLTLPGLPAVWSVSVNAFVFAVGALALLQLLGRLRGGGPEVLILFGVALNFTSAALLSLLQFVASADALQQLVFWTMGSLASAQWQGVLMLALVLAITVPFSFRAAWRLTALRL